MATDAESLGAVRTQLVALLAAETAEQVASGPKPSYSLDGQSVDWDRWRDGMVTRIGQLTELIQKLEGPVLIRSRGRA